jgi:twitching motility protein PilT
MSGTRLALRFLAGEIPALEDLALPTVVTSLARRTNGLIVFTGPTGSGKTTALAALIDRINRTTERVIVTVEDPVEYVHRPARSVISHCEVGRDVPDYAASIRGFMRADPDVILVGEMRDRATMEAALSAAETGHLVLTTLHTSDAAQTIDRIIDAFAGDSQAQIRTQLASTLLAVISLRLVPLRNGEGRIASSEARPISCATRSLPGARPECAPSKRRSRNWSCAARSHSTRHGWWRTGRPKYATSSAWPANGLPLLGSHRCRRPHTRLTQRCRPRKRRCRPA